MDFSNITLFNLMRSKMGYLSERQSALAQNIANADTPNYRARDVEAPNFKDIAAKMGNRSARNLPMMTTNAQHIAPHQADAQFKMIDRKDTYELNPDGNNVSIEEEMMKVAENQAEYQKVLNLYRKTVEMFKTAVGRPSGT